MTDLWDGESEVDAFVLPGDAAIYEAAEADMVAEGAPEPTADESPEERPRDEQGRFAKAETEEAVAEETPEGETPAETAERLFANKYQTAEELEKAYLHAQSRLSERDERAALADQYEAYFAQQQQQQAPQQPQYQQPTDWETLIDENPAYATQLAHQQGNEAALYSAAQAWNEVAPGAPDLWAKNLALEQQVAQLGQHTQSIAAQEREREIAQRIDSLVREYPDLPDHVEDMQRIASQYPYELRAIMEGSPQEVQSATKSLYLKTRGLQADTLAQKAQETVQKLTRDEQEAVEAASVVSATRTNPEKPATIAEQIGAQWRAEDSRLSDGWNI